MVTNNGFLYVKGYSKLIKGEFIDKDKLMVYYWGVINGLIWRYPLKIIL